MKIEARPWTPQDLLDDLQGIIDEESDNYLNTRRTTLETALAYLKEYFVKDANVLTNADKIRAMTDEELAVALIHVNDFGFTIPFCQNKPECGELLDTGGITDEMCQRCMVEWLKQPAEES